MSTDTPHTPDTPDAPDTPTHAQADSWRDALVRTAETYREQRDEWQEEARQARAGEAEAIDNAARHERNHQLRLTELNALRDLINTLPWDDINTGDFHPAEGCSDVARFVDAAIALGCDADTLRPQREYTVHATVTLTTSLTVTATSAEDAEEEAANTLDGYGWTHPETDCADVTEVHIDTTEEA